MMTLQNFSTTFGLQKITMTGLVDAEKGLMIRLAVGRFVTVHECVGRTNRQNCRVASGDRPQ